MPAVPLDRKLYAAVKRRADEVFSKRTFGASGGAAPSAYKSGWIVKTYKTEGGRYAGGHDAASGLSRWFREKWIDVNRRAGGSYKSCGRRRASSGGKYPLCRPSRRVSAQTPRTLQELSRRQLSRARKTKRAHPDRHASFS